MLRTSGYFPWGSRDSPLSSNNFSEVSMLGSGVYGDAWRAFDLERQSSVVIKIPRYEYFYVTPDVALHHRSVRDALHQSHDECTLVQRMVKEDGAYPEGKPHLCQCLASHALDQVSADDVAFLVLEDCGQSIKKLLRARWKQASSDKDPQAGEAAFVANVRKWMKGALAAVRFMSGLPQPMLHMDIHYDNVVITKDNEAKLIDFGLTQRWDQDFPNLRHTRSPPEHIWTSGGWMKRYPRDKAWAYDVWSVGALYSELLCDQDSFPFKTDVAVGHFWAKQKMRGCNMGDDGVGSDKDWNVVGNSVAPYMHRWTPRRLMELLEE